MSCNHNCSNCSSQQDCQDRKSLLIETAKENSIKKIIGVISGKGGVGKSTVTSLLAINMAKRGYKVGIMDADITGPSIPKAFGITERIVGNGQLMFPQISKLGIKIISVNLLLEEPTTPVLWRGPVIGGIIKQFYADVLWEDLDFLFVDMPPGTADVALTVFQSLPVDEVVIVSTPQDLVTMIVEKAVNMCKKMEISMLGLIENMSYMSCPCCKEKIHPFGKSQLDKVAKIYDLDPLDQMPILSKTLDFTDQGLIEESDVTIVDKAALKIEQLLK